MRNLSFCGFLLLALVGCDSVVEDGFGGEVGSGGAEPVGGGGGPSIGDGGANPISAGGMGGSGGAVPPECEVADDCGASSECFTYSCDQGTCSAVDLEGQFIPDPVGNCTALRCTDGTAQPVPSIDDAPAQASCAVFACDGMEAVMYPDGFGAQCPPGECDGAGNCVACLADPSCTTWPCPKWELGQIPYNCQQEMCADPNTPAPVPDDNDKPIVPDCTTLYTCENGVLSSEPAVEGSPCHDGEGECTASGACACLTDCECAVDTDCPTPLQYCATAHCNLGFCDSVPVISGGSPFQVEGDCEYWFCTPSGPMPVNVIDPPADLPCGVGICGLNGPAWAPIAAGTPCPGGYCDGGVGLPQCVACFDGAGSCPSGFHCPAAGASACVPDP